MLPPEEGATLPLLPPLLFPLPEEEDGAGGIEEELPEGADAEDVEDEPGAKLLLLPLLGFPEEGPEGGVELEDPDGEEGVLGTLPEDDGAKLLLGGPEGVLDDGAPEDGGLPELGAKLLLGVEGTPPLLLPLGGGVDPELPPDGWGVGGAPPEEVEPLDGPDGDGPEGGAKLLLLDVW